MEDLQDAVSINWWNCCAEWHPPSFSALMKSKLIIWIMITPFKHCDCIIRHAAFRTGRLSDYRLRCMSMWFYSTATKMTWTLHFPWDLQGRTLLLDTKQHDMIYKARVLKSKICTTCTVMNCSLETSHFLSQISPNCRDCVTFFTPQVFNIVIYWSCEVFCFLILLSVHVCNTLLAARTHCSVRVLGLIMDGMCGTHLTLKAYQLHSGWQPPYPQSIIPTKRRSSCWGNHALSVLLKGHFNISIREWIALNCWTQHNTPILCPVFKCQGVAGLQNNSTEAVRIQWEQIKIGGM